MYCKTSFGHLANVMRNISYWVTAGTSKLSRRVHRTAVLATKLLPKKRNRCVRILCNHGRDNSESTGLSATPPSPQFGRIDVLNLCC